jgi:hypothetical protein
MEERITRLEAEVAELRSVVKELLSASSVSITAASFLPAALHSSNETAVKSTPFAARQNQDNAMQVQDRKVLDFFRDTTINLGIDTYYAYNFNQPVGRVNLLRAYDVLSNEFSLNQASVIFEHAPDVAAGRRWGGRLDLQYGQATDTLQGNPANEPRPDIYRNIFQAYGTYIIGLGKGVNVDFGKWSQRGERDELKYLSTENRASPSEVTPAVESGGVSAS